MSDLRETRWHGCSHTCPCKALDTGKAHGARLASIHTWGSATCVVQPVAAIARGATLSSPPNDGTSVQCPMQ